MKVAMKELSYSDRAKLPYALLLDPQTNRAAAYSNNHRTITTDATPKLIAFALANAEKTAAFDAQAHADGLPDWRPLPPWATPDVQTRLLLIWVRRPGAEAPDDDWLAIPAR